MYRKLITAVATVYVVSALIGCDSRNITEPRFYHEGDLYKIPIGPPANTGNGGGGGGGGGDPVLQPTIIPSSCSLSLYWENESREALIIRYSLPETASVNLCVVDNSGNTVAQLVNGNQAMGVHQVSFITTGLDNGIYGVSLRAGSFVQVIWFKID